ncbi:MAG: class I SAM-dependent methyltransferase [Candidatus Diapherotrites archaeon]|nr:class I SAM-dependent methyltransferase [Candidatus Diapherotrites archaeon]
MKTKSKSMARENLAHDSKVLGKKWNNTYNKYFGSKKNMLSFVKQVIPYTLKMSKVQVLYACSGPGFLGEELLNELEKKRIRADLVLLDISKEHLSQNKNQKTRKICADLLKAKIEGKFDIIIMRSSLDYFWTEKTQIQALKKLEKMLKPTGVFFNQAASMPTLMQRNLADKIYSSNEKMGKRHFQCPADIAKICLAGGFSKIKKIGNAPELIVTEKEHIERYSTSKKNIAKIQGIINKIPAEKRPNIKLTKTGYSLKFIFPIYAAKATGRF